MALEKASPIGSPATISSNPLVTTLRNTYTSFSERRDALGLSNPGTVENVDRETKKNVFLTNYMFSGLRADLTKPFSMTPLFQVSHAFSMGSQGLPPYNFTAMYGTNKVRGPRSPRTAHIYTDTTSQVFMQGNIDNEGSLSARANYQWNNSFVTKTDTQIQPNGQAMLQVDNELTGKDFSAGLKAVNPSIIEGGLSGIFIGSYLQSLTPSLAVGLEAVWSRAALNAPPEAAVSYCAKYRGSDWIASAQLQPQGAVSTSYWRKLTERVEAGVDLSLQFAPGMGGKGGLMGSGMRKEGTATMGAKYDFRNSTFRAQVDSSGKLSCLLEKRVLPPIQLVFAGEMDHLKVCRRCNSARLIQSPY
jgi:mitochondrial import receptor subunit TOM40